MVGFQIENPFDWKHFLKFIAGLYFLSSGSLALNQAQEYKLDQKMKRTADRPIASGKLSPMAGFIFAASFIFVGSHLLLEVSLMSAALGWLTIILYNGVYTYIWKPRWIYAAVPGAIPGALPITMGYAAINSDIFNYLGLLRCFGCFFWKC